MPFPKSPTKTKDSDGKHFNNNEVSIISDGKHLHNNEVNTISDEQVLPKTELVATNASSRLERSGSVRRKYGISYVLPEFTPETPRKSDNAIPKCEQNNETKVEEKRRTSGSKLLDKAKQLRRSFRRRSVPVYAKWGDSESTKVIKRSNTVDEISDSEKSSKEASLQGILEDNDSDAYSSVGSPMLKRNSEGRRSWKSLQLLSMLQGKRTKKSSDENAGGRIDDTNRNSFDRQSDACQDGTKNDLNGHFETANNGNGHLGRLGIDNDKEQDEHGEQVKQEKRTVKGGKSSDERKQIRTRWRRITSVVLGKSD